MAKLLGFLYIALGLMLTDVAGSGVMEVHEHGGRSGRTQDLLQTYTVGLCSSSRAPSDLSSV